MSWMRAACRAGDDRRQRGRVVPRGARPQGRKARRNAVDQCLGNPALHDQARPRHTDLPRIARDRAGNDAGQPVDVRRVIKHELRTLSAQLQRDGLGAVRRACRHDRGTGACRTGKRHLGNARMPRERIARGAAIALHHVEEPGRHTGLHGQFGEPDGRVRRQLGRLEHDGIAGRQRRTDFPRHHDQRKIPRRDCAHHAVGLGHDHAQMIVARGGHVAAELVGVFGKEAQAFGGERHIPGDGIAHGACGTHGFQRRQMRHVRVDQISPAAQHAGPLARRAACPVGGAPRLPGVLHGRVDHVGIGHRQIGMHRVIGRPPHGKRPVVAGIADVLAANEMARRHADGFRVEDRHRMRGCRSRAPVSDEGY